MGARVLLHFEQLLKSFATLGYAAIQDHLFASITMANEMNQELSIKLV